MVNGMISQSYKDLHRNGRPPHVASATITFISYLFPQLAVYTILTALIRLFLLQPIRTVGRPGMHHTRVLAGFDIYRTNLCSHWDSPVPSKVFLELEY